MQAFRRADCSHESVSLKLRGLDRAAKYAITDLDTGELRQLSAREIADGVSVIVKRQPGSVLLTYARK